MRAAAVSLALALVFIPARFANAALYITEFMATNATTLADEDGAFSDWVEIYNSGPGSKSLAGWHLTDDAANLAKWTFPSISLPAGGYLVVFASDKDRSTAGSELHTNFKLSGTGEYLGLVDPDGVTIVHEYAPTFPPQITDVSYGLTVDLGAERCFLDPTPAATNDESTVCAAVDTLTFSATRGFYNAPFNLAITTATAGAKIRYTLDGSAPTSTHGTLYSSPIQITTTTVVRALGYIQGVLPEPPSVTQSYIFLDDVVQQPANVAGYPNPTYDVGNGETAPHDYEMDPSIVNNSAYTADLFTGLRAIPTVSLAVDRTKIFGSSGFYDGTDVEVPASVEIIYPAGSALTSEQANCGVESHSTKRLKRSLQLQFKGAYGPSTFDSNLLETGPTSGDSAKEKLERIVLRGGNNRSWARDWNPDRTTYTEDEFYRSSQIAMSGVGSHGAFVHLYINGLYWGLYNAVEQPEEHFEAIYLGGNSTGWFSTSHSGVEVGDATRWEYLRGALVAKNLSTAANYAELQQYLDVTNFADYLILSWYTATTDWPDNNWYAGNRNDVPGPLRYYAWDGEWSWDRALGQTVNGAWVHPSFRVSSNSTADLARIWRAVKANTDFMMLFADRVHRHTSGLGALTDNASHARWATVTAYIYDAVVAESARWGDALQTLGQPTRTRNGDWQFEVDNIDNLITGNSARLISALRGQGYYPSIDAPNVKIAGTTATITNPNSSGQIQYTTDGSDPRAPGGAVAGSAHTYAGSFSVQAGTIVRARVKNGATWSALDELQVAQQPGCTVNADCNDANPCTTNTCNVSGVCVTTNNSVSCNDGLFCTTGDKCGGGSCNGTPNRCSGGTPFCDESADTCNECAGGGDCDDGAYCNGAERCVGGSCAPATSTPCGAGLFCNEASNVCVGCLQDQNCDDGLYCTGAEHCVSGSCEADGNPCAGGPECANSCNEGADSCNTAVATPCSDDGNPCTDDLCDGLGACKPVANTAPCDDQLFCTIDDTCGGGICRGTAGPCVGSTPLCNESINACVECFDASACDDGLFCNGVPACVAGSCQPSLGNPCTGDLVCDEATDACVGCTKDADCDDENACTTGHVCSGNVCSDPKPVVCDDGLFCDGVESCDPALGCVAGVPFFNCSTLNTACSLSVCDESTRACRNDPTNDAGECDDADTCTIGDVCSAGLCSGASPCDADCEACVGDGSCLSRCGHPVSPATGRLSASDALYMLQAGIGLMACPLCVCDINASGATSATDALIALQAGVGLDLPIECPPAAAALAAPSTSTSTTTTLE